MKDIDFLCSEINRRIKTMNYSEEKELREHLTDCLSDDKLDVSFVNVTLVSDILDVNEQCIEKVLQSGKKN